MLFRLQARHGYVRNVNRGGRVGGKARVWAEEHGALKFNFSGLASPRSGADFYMATREYVKYFVPR